MRLTHRHKGWVYWSSSLLFISGLLWLTFHYFLQVHGQFGQTPHPLEPWFLRTHGGAAMLFLVVAGSLLPVHVRRGWHQRKNLPLGIAVLVLALLLTCSGYALYYFGGEEMRPLISAFHWIIGLAAPALLIWHVVVGRTLHASGSQSSSLSKPQASPPTSTRYGHDGDATPVGNTPQS